MSAQGKVTLRILERADREILELPRVVKGSVYEFQSRFRANPNHPSLRFKRLKGDSRLFSARVGPDHRALLLHVGEQDYLLVSVKDRKEVYDDLSRYSYQINRVTGGIEVIDLSAIGDSIVGRMIAPGEDEAGGRTTPVERAAPEVRGMFAAVDDQTLIDLGVSEPLLPSIRRLTTIDQLLAFVDCVPQLTSDVLLALHDGKSVEQVQDIVTTPVAVEESVDTDDFVAAVARPATQVTADDAALQAILAESFARWQVFLHPTQRKLVERRFNGPARVGGGPGTGKTIVALHRAAHLARRLPAGPDRPILLTTFNRNLAADLRTRLLELAGPEVTARVDIVNIDSLTTRVVLDEGEARRRTITYGTEIQEWEDMLLELAENRWDAEFLAAEWSQVILGQVLRSRADYFRARRPGRGRQLSRQDRDAVWRLVERFTKRLADKQVWTWQQIAEHAAELEIERQARITAVLDGDDGAAGSGSLPRFRYRHVIVDEAQDLSPAHWKLLRAMVASGPNDIFLVGDTHQRIYDNVVTLGSLGVNIRGRSARLTLSYRTTREILRIALELLHGEKYDDLDGGAENLAGYRSLLHGAEPMFVPHATWEEEQHAISEQVRVWGDAADGGQIAVCVPTRALASDVLARLTADGMEAVEIGPDGPGGRGGVHVGTMHRFKGLEYRRMILAGVSAGLVPRGFLDRYLDTDPRRYDRERRKDRSLLFVAATRARDELAISWHGPASPFLGDRGHPPGRPTAGDEPDSDGGRNSVSF